MNQSTRRILSRAAVAAVLPLAALAGCESSGLSPREGAGRNFSTYVYSLTPVTDLPAAENAQPARLVLPGKIAVAQIGEVTPNSRFLNKLRSSTELFSRVDGMSGLVDIEPAYPRRDDSPVTTEHHANRDMARFLRVARDMGMDHLLLVGGTIDQVTKENGLSVLDLTIVGAFVVPSKEIDAEAKASGALIDLSSGRVVLFASADATLERRASTVTRSAGEIDTHRAARDEVLVKLAGEVIEQCKNRAQSGAAAGST